MADIKNLNNTSVRFESGSNLTPGIAFIDDPNTGIYQDAADNIKFAIGGSEKVRFDTNGIGVSAGNVYVANDYRMHFDYGTSNNYYIRKTSSNLEIYSAGNLAFGADSATKMFVSQSGDVGIGTTAPTDKLEVNGTARFGDGSPYLKVTTSSVEVEGAYLFAAYQSGVSFYAYDSVFRGLIKSDSSGDNALKLGDTQERIRIVGGNVGIGTTSPSERLQINGGNIWAPGDVRRVILGELASTGDVHFGSSGIGTPATGSQDYGFYAAHNAYRTSTGAWLHSRTSTIPAVRLLGSAGVSSGNQGFSFDYSANVGTAAITWTNLMKILPTGNVGIGTTDPDAIFHVAKATSAGIGGQIVIDNPVASAVGNTAEISFLTDTGASGAGTRNGRILAVNENAGNGAANMQFHTWNGAASAERMRITSAGKVGIGNSSPTQALTVEGNISASGYIDVSGSVGTGIIKYNGSDIVRVMSPGGALSIGKDDGIIIGAGEMRNMIESNVNEVSELVWIGAEGGVWNYAFPNNGASWDSRVATLIAPDGYFQIFSGSAERFRFDTDGNSFLNGGNVGIGTTSPSSKFEVSTSGLDGITLSRTAQNAGNVIYSRSYDTSNVLRYSNRILFGATAGVGRADGYLAFETAFANTLSERMRITSDGNVGIGVTTPTSKLEIRDETADHRLISINRPASDTAALYIGNDSSTPANAVISSNYSDLIFGRDQSGTLTEHVRIKRDGSVGIGTTSPAQKLDVNGAGIVRGGLVVKYGSNSGEVDTAYAPLLVNGPSTNTITYDEETTTATLVLRGNADNVNLQMGTGGSLIGPYGGWIQASYDNVGASGSEPLLLNPIGGNVGIGNTSPGYKLDVKSGGASTFFTSFTPSAGSGFIRVYQDSNNHLSLYGANASGTTNLVLNTSGVSYLKGGNVIIGGSADNGNTLQVQGNSYVAGDLTVTGTVTAQEFHTEFVSASIIYQSGSTQFGNSSDDVHTFTGTATVTGNNTALSIRNINPNGSDTGLEIRGARNGAVGTATSYIHFTNNDDNSGGLHNLARIYGAMASAADNDGTLTLQTWNGSAYSTGIHIDEDGSTAIGTFNTANKFGVLGSAQIGTNDLANAFGRLQVNQLANNDESGIGILSSGSGRSMRLWVDETTSYVNSADGGSGKLVLNQGAGNVGIGTASPSSSLHIKTGTDSSVDQGIIVERSLNSDKGYINYQGGGFQFRATDGDPLVFGTVASEQMRIDSSAVTLRNIASNQGVLQFSTNTAYQIRGGGNYGYLGYNSIYHRFDTLGSEVMRITGSYVGIGNSSPGTKLHVGAGSGATVDTGYQLAVESAGIAGIQILAATNQSSRVVFGDSDDNDVGMLRYDHTDNSMRFNTNGSANERMRITSDGNVGIGTTTPSAKLTVEGSIVASQNLTTTGHAVLNGGLYHNSNIRVLNKAGSNWLTWATRDASGAEAVINLSNIGTLSTAGDSTIDGDLTVTGIVTAQEFHTEFVSASIIYQSGSTKFGDTADDVHQFTGSLEVQSGSYRVDNFEEGIEWFNGTNYTSNRIRLSATQNLQVQAGGVIQLQSNTQITSGRDFIFNNTDNTTRFDINNAGSSGEYRLDFSSGSTQLMVISGSGNVGIGTTAPTAKLDVNGNIAIATTSPSTATNLISMVGGRASFGYDGTISSAFMRSSDISKPLVFGSGTSELMRIVSSTGNVGIGTTSPSQKLEIAGDTLINNSGNGKVYLGSTDHYLGTISSNLYTVTSGQSIFYAGSSESMRIGTNGNVGIGTTNTGAVKLNVYASGATDYVIAKFGNNNANIYGVVQFSSGSTTTGTIGWHQPGYFFSSANGVNSGQEMMLQGVQGLTLGTNTTGSLSIKNTTADVIIDSKVDLGIGIASPTQTVDITGVARFRGGSARNLGSGDTPSDAALIVDRNFYIYTHDTGGYLRKLIGKDSSNIIHIGHPGTSLVGEIRLQPGIDGPVTFYSASAEYARFAGGNLMIGNTSAAARIDVREDSGYAFRAEDAAGHYFRVQAGGNVEMRGDLTVGGIVTAQEFHTEFVSASIIYQSGSTKFGDTADDVHQFTGSVNILGNTLITGGTGDALLTIEADTDNSGEEDNPTILIKQDGGNVVSSLGMVGSAGQIFTNSQQNAGYFLSQEYLQFGVNSAARLTINSNGYTGIGTNNPQTQLHLWQSTSTTSSTTGTTLLRLDNYVGTDLNQQKTFIDFVLLDGNNNEYPQVRIGAEVGPNGNADSPEKEGEGAFVVYTNNATGEGPGSPTGLAERFRVDYQGNVGIGTTNPLAPLHVVYSQATAQPSLDTESGLVIRNSNASGRASIKLSSANNSIIYSDGSGASTLNFYDRHAGAERMRIDSNGNVGIGTTSLLTKLSIADNSSGAILSFKRNNSTTAGAKGGLTWVDSSNYYVAGISVLGDGTTDNSGELVFRTSTGAASNTDLGYQLPERMRIDSAGNVGIGTTSPSTKLHVVGASDIVSYSNGTTTGYLLSDANGVGLFNGATGSGTGIYVRTANILDFYYNSSIGIRLSSTGNVGIGTTSPSSRLHVTGDTYVTGQFAQGVAVASKKLGYGAEFRSSGASIQIVMGRDANATGSGAIGADENSIFSAWNIDSGASEKFRIAKSGAIQAYYYGSGNVTGTAAYRLAVDSSGNIIEESVGAGLVDGSGAATRVAYWSDSNTLTSDASFTFDGNKLEVPSLVETSARKYKSDIKPISGSLEKLQQLQGVSFVRIGEDKHQLGFIADEVANIYPELVSYNENGEVEALQYARITAVLVESVKELNDKVKAQDLFIKDLVARIEKLENK